MESLIKDYRTIDGVNIAHAGRTSVSLARYGGSKRPEQTSRNRIEEVWAIEEVDFNIKGLSIDCFLPPADLKEEYVRGCGVIPPPHTSVATKVGQAGVRRSVSMRSNGWSRIAAVDEDIAGFEDL